MRKVKSLQFLVIALTIFLIPVASYSKDGTALPDKTKIMAKAAKLQIPFIENQGQVDKSVRFYANTFAGNVYVTEKGEIVYGLTKVESKGQKTKDVRQETKNTVGAGSVPAHISSQNVTDEPLSAKTVAADFSLQNSQEPLANSYKCVSLKETLIGAKDLKVSGQDKAVIKVNYFVGDKKNWRNNISTYDEVSLGKVYDNIELKLRAYGKNVEKLFTVNPDGRVEDIKLNFEGAKGIKINESGELEISTELGSVKFTKPYAYQEIDGKRVEVKADFQIQTPKLSNLNPEPRQYGFTVASHNPNYPLIIDPLLASTFIGGVDEDRSILMGIDSSGNIFLAGYTSSSSFPVTIGSYDTSYNTMYDAFVLKINNSLNSILSSTFIGGSSGDESYSIALDSLGNVYITGGTSSTDYPTTTGAYDTSHNGNKDVFVSKLNNDLSSLLTSTFIGGSSKDEAYSIAIDSSGNIFITGETLSSDYPVTEGTYDPSHNSPSLFYYDVFVSKLDNSLSSLLASTFIGGSVQDYGSSIALDSSGNVFVTGYTQSSNYPVTVGAYDTTFNGTGFDVFVSKLDNSLSSLLSSTFIEGSSHNLGFSIALDSADNVFVAGETWSSDFPTTGGAYDTTYNGGIDDVFVSKLDNSLSSLLASTFIGGSNYDEGYSIAFDSAGNVFVTGYTDSSDFPTISGTYDTTHNGAYDVFVSKLNNSLSSLLSSTFIGGSQYDLGSSIALDSSGNVFVTGATSSSNYPTTLGTYDTSYNGTPYDVFVSKLDNNLSADIPTAITLSNFDAKQKGKTVAINWQTGTEIDNIGFNILRSESENSGYVKINKKIILAKGSATKGASYKFVDGKVKAGKVYYYKLEDIDSGKGPTQHGPVKVEMAGLKKKKR